MADDIHADAAAAPEEAAPVSAETPFSADVDADGGPVADAEIADAAATIDVKSILANPPLGTGDSIIDAPGFAEARPTGTEY